MAKEFTKLSEVAVVEEVTDGATVLIEENGEIYRAPKTSVGGGGVATAIIRDSEYLSTIAGLSQYLSAAPEYTYECINMTFEEAYEIMLNGEPLQAIGMLSNIRAVINGAVAFAGVAIGVPCIVLSFSDYAADYIKQLYWTADGISTGMPAQEK